MKVLVLEASALHLGFIGCYGNAWIATPCLDRLAAQGVVFDLHIADVLGSRSCWTGRMLEKGPELPALLKTSGIACAHVEAKDSMAETLERAKAVVHRLEKKTDWLLWVDLPSLHPPWQIADDSEDDAEEISDDEDDDSEQEVEEMSDQGDDVTGDGVVEADMDISDDDDFVPGMDDDEQPPPLVLDPPIGPVDTADIDLWESIRTTYARAVMAFDDDLGWLVEELDKLLDDVTIIVTADRGLALGEHGFVGDYRPWLHDEVVHLPLIVRQPLARDAGRRVYALTQPVDLAATLMELFGLPASSVEGRSWLPLLADQATAIREHAPSAWALGEFSERSLRTLDWALVLPSPKADQAARPVQLYAKPEDRWEANNLLQQRQELAEELERITERLLPQSAAGIFVAKAEVQTPMRTRKRE